VSTESSSGSGSGGSTYTPTSTTSTSVSGTLRPQPQPCVRRGARPLPPVTPPVACPIVAPPHNARPGAPHYPNMPKPGFAGTSSASMWSAFKCTSATTRSATKRPPPSRGEAPASPPSPLHGRNPRYPMRYYASQLARWSGVLLVHSARFSTFWKVLSPDGRARGLQTQPRERLPVRSVGSSGSQSKALQANPNPTAQAVEATWKPHHHGLGWATRSGKVPRTARASASTKRAKADAPTASDSHKVDVEDCHGPSLF
jgi:hypothetical protein